MQIWSRPCCCIVACFLAGKTCFFVWRARVANREHTQVLYFCGTGCQGKGHFSCYMSLFTFPVLLYTFCATRKIVDFFFSECTRPYAHPLGHWGRSVAGWWSAFFDVSPLSRGFFRVMRRTGSFSTNAPPANLQQLILWSWLILFLTWTASHSMANINVKFSVQLLALAWHQAMPTSSWPWWRTRF